MHVNFNVRYSGLLSLFVSIVLLSGCATMFTPATVEVRFTAEPADGSKIYVQGMQYELNGQPIVISKKSKEVLFSNATYGDFIIPLDRHVNGGWVAMDILLTPGYGIIGVAVDASTADWYRYPTNVAFDFQKATAVQTSGAVVQRKVISMANPVAASAARVAHPIRKKNNHI